MISYDGTSSSSGLSVVTRYVPGDRYPAAVARLSGLLGGGGLAALAAHVPGPFTGGSPY
jgi:hypothetical protein